MADVVFDWDWGYWCLSCPRAVLGLASVCRPSLVRLSFCPSSSLSVSSVSSVNSANQSVNQSMYRIFSYDTVNPAPPWRT